MIKNDFFDKIEQAYSRNSSIEELKIFLEKDVQKRVCLRGFS